MTILHYWRRSSNSAESQNCVTSFKDEWKCSKSNLEALKWNESTVKPLYNDCCCRVFMPMLKHKVLKWGLKMFGRYGKAVVGSGLTVLNNFSQCVTKSDNTMKGTCFTSTECTSKGGVADGNCAAGKNSPVYISLPHNEVHLDNVITFGTSPSDHIKRLLL